MLHDLREADQQKSCIAGNKLEDGRRLSDYNNLEGRTYCFKSHLEKRLVAEFTKESGKAVFPSEDGMTSTWPVKTADVTGASFRSQEEWVREAPLADLKKVAGKVWILNADLADLGAAVTCHLAKQGEEADLLTAFQRPMPQHAVVCNSCSGFPRSSSAQRGLTWRPEKLIKTACWPGELNICRNRL